MVEQGFTFDTGVRAVWYLFRVGRWSLLEQLGLSRSEYEMVFRSYDLLYMPDTPPEAPLRVPRMTTQTQINRFVQICPEVKAVACRLLSMHYTGETL